MITSRYFESYYLKILLNLNVFISSFKRKQVYNELIEFCGVTQNLDACIYQMAELADMCHKYTASFA